MCECVYVCMCACVRVDDVRLYACMFVLVCQITTHQLRDNEVDAGLASQWQCAMLQNLVPATL